MEVRLALIPNPVFSKKMGGLGKAVGSKFSHRFLVDNKKYFPHATLFKVNIRKDKYPELLSITKDFVKGEKNFGFKIKGLATADGGWVDLEVLEKQKIFILRNTIYRKLKLAKITKLKKLKPSYRPHFTLTRFFSNHKASLAVQNFPKQNFKLNAYSIGLCLSKQTQVYKILDKVKLK
jgi:2'-5' RNA ligase